MDNSNFALRGDMYVQAHIIISKQNAILVPSGALFSEQGKNYLFRQSKGSNAYEKITVTKISDLRDQSVIKEGINPGDIIVADGGLLLNAGLSKTDAP